MKLMRNKFVVGALVLVAALLVFRNAIYPLLPDWGSKKKPASSAKAPSKPSVSTSSTTPKANPDTTSTRKAEQSAPFEERNLVLGDTPMNLKTIKNSVSRWIDAPSRDPFRGYYNAGTEEAAATVLTLTGIWRQTGQNLAVVNEKVMAVGEQIEGFTINSIEENHIWVQGPNGLETVGFSDPTAPPAAKKTITQARATTQRN